MKTIRFSFLLAMAALAISSCDKVSYRKTKTGMAYKLYPGKSKDSLIGDGQIVKFEVTYKVNDSLVYSSYGKMPGYAKLMVDRIPPYNIMEVFPLMRKGDSAVTVQMADTMMKMGMQMLPSTKKGDRITSYFRITEVYPNDSIAMIYYKADQEKDKPRQMKEQAEMEAKAAKERQEQDILNDKELEKSGEIARELQEMESYLSAKKISAQKTGMGTFVAITDKGNGPAAQSGKYVRVKYTGKVLANDSTFQSSVYAFKLGAGDVVRGWDQGLLLFNQGGKGTIYIPGFLAFGNKPNSPFKPYAALKFDVEVMNVSDTVLTQ